MRSSLKVLVRHHVASRICLCVRAQLSSRQHIPLPLACARCTSRSLKHHAHPAPTPTAQSQTGTPPPGAPIASRSPALSRASPACPRVPPPRLQRPCAPQARVRRPPCKRARERERARWGPSVPAARRRLRSRRRAPSPPPCKAWPRSRWCRPAATRIWSGRTSVA